MTKARAGKRGGRGGILGNAGVFQTALLGKSAAENVSLLVQRPRSGANRTRVNESTFREVEAVLGAGLEPACLSAYAPQTYVSAIPPPERAFER